MTSNKYYRWIIGGFVAVICSILPFQIAYADDPDHCGSGAGGVGEAAIEAYVPGPPNTYILEQPFGGRSVVATAGEYIQLVYSYAAGIIGIIAVVLIMAGGFMWITAGGNEQTIGTAKDIIVSAVTAVFIMVLSYAILYVVNPKFTTQTFQVPKIPIKGCVVPDGEVVSIPSHANLNGSGQLCPGAAAALIQIADELAKVCADCKIGIGSTYRSSESQEPLYAGYAAAVEAGYFAEDGTTKIKTGCPPESNGSCNLAAKPCCSNHRQGIAIDAWFEFPGGDDVTISKTSAGKLSQDFNNGGGDAALKANQDTLKAWMQLPIGGKQLFKGIMPAEWWHFDYQGNCGSAGGCQASSAVDGFSTPADNTYCKSTSPVSTYMCSYPDLTTEAECLAGAGTWGSTSSGQYIYRHANCANGDPQCPTFGGFSFTEVTDGACGSSSSSSTSIYGGGYLTLSYYSFDGVTKADAPSQSYYAKPNCITTTTGGSGSCPFVTVKTDIGTYEVDNNILPQSEDRPGNEVVTDIYALNHTPMVNEQGEYSLQIKEWEKEKSFIDKIQLWKLPANDNLEYATTPANTLIAYTPGRLITQCELNNGVRCVASVLSKDMNTVPGIPGDELTVKFNAVEDYTNLGLLITAQGRDRATLDIKPDGALSTLADKLINFIIPSANAKTSLHVYIKKQSGEWEKMSELHPRELPANFELLNLADLENLPDVLEVKLVWTGYHSLDTIQIVEMQPLQKAAQLVPLRSATHSTIGDVTAQISTVDENYMTLVPQEQVDLIFKDLDSKANPHDFVYFFESTGYYFTVD